MITVHHLNESRSQRILWLLEELGIDYDIEFHQRDPHTRQAPDALKAIHPLGKSPIVTDGDRVIAESGAIVDYIIRRHGGGRLQPDPATPEYDDYVFWMHYAEGSATVPLVLKSAVGRLGDAGLPLMGRIEGELSLHLGFIDQHLKNRDFLLGDKLTGADIQCSFVGEFAAIRTELSNYPHLHAWVARFQALPAYQAAVERGGPPIQ